MRKGGIVEADRLSLPKLIELHFSPVKAPVVPPPPPPPKAPPRRSSSAFSLDFESLKNPGDLWRGLKERSVSTSSGLGGNVTAESKRGELNELYLLEEVDADLAVLGVQLPSRESSSGRRIRR